MFDCMFQSPETRYTGLKVNRGRVILEMLFRHCYKFVKVLNLSREPCRKMLENRAESHQSAVHSIKSCAHFMTQERSLRQ